MDEIIPARMADIGKYLHMIKKYFEAVKVIIEGTNIDEFRLIISNINNIENLITDYKIPQDVSSDESKRKVAAMNVLWGDFQRIYNSMDYFNNTLLAPKYLEKVILTMSQSGGMEFKLLHNNIHNLYERILNDARTTDAEIFNKIMPTLDKGDCVEFLLTDETINSFTTSLIYYLVKSGSENDRARLRKLIEDRKDNVLDVTRKLFVDSKNSIESMPLMYGLVPACTTMPISDLLNELGFGEFFTMKFGGVKKEYKTTHTLERTRADNLPHITPKNTINKSTLIDILNEIISKTKQQFGFVVLDRGSKSVIEFDIRGLILPSYVSMVATNPNFGLNKKFIKRFSTITHHPESAGDDIVRLVPATAKFVYIIDIFIYADVVNAGGMNARILSQELGKYKTFIENIPGLIIGVTTRPYQYNKILSERILGEYFDPLAEGIIGTLSEIKSGKSSEAIKNKIINAYLAHYDDIQPTTYDDFKSMFTTWEKLDDVLINAMLHIVYKQPTAEMLLTYLVKINDVSRMFVAELEAAFKDAGVSIDMFTQLGKADLQKQLREITRQIVTLATNQLDQGNQWTKHSISLKEHFIDKKYENI